MKGGGAVMLDREKLGIVSGREGSLSPVGGTDASTFSHGMLDASSQKGAER